MSFFDDDEVESFDDVHVVYETDAALLIRFDEHDEQWIPKSQISPASDVCKKGDTGILIVTRWIAEQKGLV